MINSIIIKNIATFDEVGIEISNLKKVNFIYGANGSGKTTISRFLNNQNNEGFEDCSLFWKGEMPIKTLVYNKEFREQNFGKGNINGVFTLGQATKEEIEKIETKQVDLEKSKAELIKKKETLETLKENKDTEEDKFKNLVWSEIYKEYDYEFKEAFVGVMRKEAFKQKLLIEFKNSSSLLTYEELQEKANTIFGEIPETISSILEINFGNIVEIENDNIWQKKIIGKADVDISNLIHKLNLNDWVNQGRDYIQENDTCPFCQQETISKDFRKQLGDYFDETFTTEIKLVKENIENYKTRTSYLLTELTQIELQNQTNENSKLNIDKFSLHLKTLSSQITSNNELLHNKVKEPSRSIELIKIKSELKNIQEIIVIANKEIEKHNKIVIDFEKERKKLIQAVWRFITEHNKITIQNFIKKDVGRLKGIDKLRLEFQELKNKYANLDKEIKEASKNITNTKPSVNAINNTLKSYGFLNFEIVPSKTDKNQYQIQREDGTLAEATLSEGEITFITFLYFLQLAKGSISEETITEERVLVIDDPVSSLDSNVLFVVSSLLKEMIKSIKKEDGSIKQLILFTHNVYFHKEVSFTDGRTNKFGNTYYWILRKNNNRPFLQSFEMENPIKNSYELLWQELKNRNNNSGITIQNIMRRIIENYFKILGKYGDDDLIDKFKGKEEQEICRSLLSWINDGSHSIPDDIFVEYQEDTNEKYFNVFKNIFIYTKHFEHYKMMMDEQIIHKNSE